MKRSVKPTEHILIKTSTNSEWDPVDFAIIHLTDLCKAVLLQRLLAVRPFAEDNSFSCHTYWDQPSGYYRNPEYTSLTDEVLQFLKMPLPQLLDSS